MKRIVLIIVGCLLLIFGMYYSYFWGQAIRESGLLYSTGQIESEEATREQFPYFVKAVDRLGKNLFLPATDETPHQSPVDLAKTISRGMYTHFTLGLLSSLLGVILTAVGFQKRKHSLESAAGGSG